MNQSFRQDIDSIPTGHFSDLRERCRLRVLDSLKRQHARTHRCNFCGNVLLITETSKFCCGNGHRQHYLWTKASPELQRIYDTPGMASQSRMLNSLFSSSVVYSSDAGHGFSYHSGSGPPSLRISGQMYNRMMRTAENCWFVHDAKFSDSFSRLSARFQDIAVRFRTILLKSANPYATINSLPQYPPTIDSLRNGKVGLTLEPNADHMFAVFVGPGGAPPERTLLHVGSRKAIQEEDSLWDLLAYPVFHPLGAAAASDTWRRNCKSIVGTTTLTLLGYLRSVMFSEPNYWKCGRLAHQHVLDTWSRNEQILAKQWKSPAIQQRIRGYVDRIYGASAIHHSKIFLPASVPGSFRYQQRFFHDGLYIASRLGNPHLFITMTANPHWPEIRDLLRPGEVASDRLDLIARAFDLKRRRLIELLETPDFLFPGHLGVEYMIWVTEWQLCGLPHLHLAVCLRSSLPLVNLQDQVAVMDKVISARYPLTSGEDYDLVQTFMVHNDPCVVCLRDNARTGTRECRFHFPKEPSDHPKIDAKGYPIYRRSKQDIRVVPHNIKLLRELQCHCNVEWTFACGCIAYLYKYFSKGCDSAGVKISDFNDEIAAFRRARILTAGEACYRAIGYRVNYRDPSVMLCKFSLPPDAVERARDEDKFAYDYMRGDPDALLQNVAQEDPTVDTHNNQFPFESEDGLQEPPIGDNTTAAVHGDLISYFSRPVEIQEELTFTRFYEVFYMIPAHRSHLFSERTLADCFMDIEGNYWKERNGRNRLFARMQWMSPTIGELYYLRKLLLQFPARSYADVYRGFQSFKESAEDAGLVEYEHESMHALLDATNEQFSSSMVRQLFATLMLHSGHNRMSHCWENDVIRSKISFDFLPCLSRGETWEDEHRVAEWLTLCDLVLLAYEMGKDIELDTYGLPAAPISEEEILTLLQRVGPHNITLTRYMTHRSISIQQVPGNIRIRIARDSLNEVRAHASLPVDSQEDLQTSVATLTPIEQLPLFNHLTTTLHAGLGGTIFIDAPAGCGKTYVTKIFLRYCHHHTIIALPCATTGIASLQYDIGRTSHNLFHIFPEEDKQILEGPKIQSRLVQVLLNGKTNARIELLRRCSVITWDEFPMAPKNLVEAVDRLLRLVKNRPHVPFGGVLIITLGDFRQVSPVNSDAAQRNTEHRMAFATSAFHDSIKSSYLWPHFASNTICLSDNIRAKTDPAFHVKLMKVGDGITGEIITVADLGLQVFNKLEDACQWVFEDISLDNDETLEQHYNPRDSSRRAILAPFNRDIDEVNRMCCQRYKQLYPDTQEVILLSADTVEHDHDLSPPEIPTHTHDPELALCLAQQHSLDDAEAQYIQRPVAGLDCDTLRFDMGMLQEQKLDSSTFCDEVLHALHFQGVPPHSITTWVGASVILLRNINPKQRLLNGSRMCVEWVHPGGRVISVRHAEEANLPSAPVYLLPRLRFQCKMNGYDAQVTRKQFPIRQAYGLTIHKSQSATLDRVVVDLRHGVFDHGQLYVALSRVRNARDVRILINKGQEHLLNIVHAILLGK